MKEKVQEVVRQLNIIDDTFFQKMVEDIGFCEEMISTILGEKVMVKSVIPQNSIKNLQGRSVVLDALCILENGKYCNIEVQKADDDNHTRRIRYNTSCITANITEPGTKFEKVPNVIGYSKKQIPIILKNFQKYQDARNNSRKMKEEAKRCVTL